MSWTDFEHDIWKLLIRHGLQNQETFLLSVSGGLDSMALLQIMSRLKPNAHLTVAYFHHGASEPQQENYRDACLDLIRSTCENLKAKNVRFISSKAETKLTSEAELREARWTFINGINETKQPILTAHHLDDWVETLTLKLIRGVGAEGFTAFKVWNEKIFRPFLEISKKQLMQYALEQKLTWLDDPSNDSSEYLRNWLRRDWFKMLDEKNPSGYDNYSRSLLRLCQELTEVPTLSLCFFRDDTKLGLDRSWYFSLNESRQRKAIALYCRHQSQFNMTQGQIAEIQKRLDKNQKDITFVLGSIKWLITSQQIMIEF